MGAIKKIIATQPGVRYRVKLGYVHGGNVGGGMEVYNGGEESTQSIGGSGWLNKTTERVFEFVPDSDMVMLKFFSGEVTGLEANMYLSKVEISIANSNHYSRIRGDKTYELSNHLGNVLATITDRKLGFSNNTSNNIASHYQAEVTSATDYYPFGSPMSKRSVFDYKSKYGFNSAEKHNELDNLDGLDYDLGARFYSSKLGRMFSPDPRESEYPWQSTYAYFSNSPISQVDINGEGGGEGKSNENTTNKNNTPKAPAPTNYLVPITPQDNLVVPHEIQIREKYRNGNATKGLPFTYWLTIPNVFVYDDNENNETTASTEDNYDKNKRSVSVNLSLFEKLGEVQGKSSVKKATGEDRKVIDPTGKGTKPGQKPLSSEKEK